MKTLGAIRLYCLLALCPLALFGCYESAGERQPFNQLKAGPDRAMAMKYKNILEAKAPRIKEIFELKLDIPKDAPFTPETVCKIAAYMATTKDKELKSYFEDLERYSFYYTKVKEKGGDLSGLELDIFPTMGKEQKDIIMPLNAPYTKRGVTP